MDVDRVSDLEKKFMRADKNIQTLVISRRKLFGGAALVAGASALLGAATAAAQTKVAQSVVRYQGTPRGNARCDNCVQWLAPSSCKVVQGSVAAAGWCMLYAPAPRH